MESHDITKGMTALQLKFQIAHVRNKKTMLTEKKRRETHISIEAQRLSLFLILHSLVQTLTVKRLPDTLYSDWQLS